jgi:formylmethanofuran dehydrogenase subunit A
LLIQLKSGNVYDPHNKIFNIRKDIYIKDGSIVDKKHVSSKIDKVIDCRNKIVMPGAIDMHTHIGGGKVNIARLMLEEFHNEQDPNFDITAIIAPSTLKTGLKYIEMGYTSCFEPALLPVNARQAHAEMSDIPFIDKGGYVLLGNDDYFLDLVRKKASQSSINDYIAFVLKATQCIGVKVVNPGGINAFKFNQRALNVDEKSKYYDITPREIVSVLTRGIHDLGIPHPLHVHCSNLGVPGNFLSTIETIKAANGLPIHLTHIQFQSYGNNGDRGFSSAAVEISNYLNKIPNLTCDVGQIMFGQTVTMSGDSMTQHKNHKHAHPNKWMCMDIECEAGCGVVPFKYQDKSFVNALQWAIGLEIFLLAEDPWKVFLTTDHPNGAPFTSYPHLIKLLMDKSFRNDILNQLPKDILEHTILNTLNREYTLNEIAIMTRSAPAKILGLSKKGNFSHGSDADITIYDKNKKDPEDMFAHPSMVLKDGKVVVENGKIKEYVWGKTQTVAPEYDKSIEKNLGKFFDKYHTMKLSNYIISDDEMERLVGSPVNINECKHKRKE